MLKATASKKSIYALVGCAAAVALSGYRGGLRDVPPVPAGEFHDHVARGSRGNRLARARPGYQPPPPPPPPPPPENPPPPPPDDDPGGVTELDIAELRPLDRPLVVDERLEFDQCPEYQTGL